MRLPLHTIEFFSISIKNWEQKKKEMSAYLDNTKYVKRKDYDGLLRFSTDRHSERDYINQFMSIFSDELTELLQDLGVEEMNIVDIWSVKYKKGDFHSVHTHGSVQWSAVLYYDYDHELHSGTHFVVEDINAETNSSLIKSPEAREGIIYVFPANMIHFTTPNESDKERTIISFDFNTNPKFLRKLT
jgi:hypothetical protein